MAEEGGINTEITIKATPEEIAALAAETQKRRDDEIVQKAVKEVIRQMSTGFNVSQFSGTELDA